MSAIAKRCSASSGMTALNFESHAGHGNRAANVRRPSGTKGQQVRQNGIIGDGSKASLVRDKHRARCVNRGFDQRTAQRQHSAGCIVNPVWQTLALHAVDVSALAQAEPARSSGVPILRGFGVIRGLSLNYFIRPQQHRRRDREPRAFAVLR